MRDRYRGSSKFQLVLILPALYPTLLSDFQLCSDSNSNPDSDPRATTRHRTTAFYGSIKQLFLSQLPLQQLDVPVVPDSPVSSSLSTVPLLVGEFSLITPTPYFHSSFHSFVRSNSYNKYCIPYSQSDSVFLTKHWLMKMSSVAERASKIKMGTFSWIK